MRRSETPLPAAVARDLELIDAALAGERRDGDAAERELTAIVLAVRDLRELPDPEARDRIDARIAAAREPRARQITPRRLVPAAGLAGGALAALLLALTLGRSDGGDPARTSGGSAAGGPVAALTTTEPAPVEQAGRLDQRTVPSAKSAAPQADAVAPSATTTAPALAPAAPAAGGGARRSIERSAELRLAAAPGKLQDVAAGVLRVADDSGGFVRSSTVDERGRGGSASFDLRIPSARLQQTLGRLSRLASVRSRTQGAFDVTGQVDGARLRVQALEAERRALVRQLAASTTLEQGARIRARLRGIDRRLARAQAQREALRRRTSYSSVAVQVDTARAGAVSTAGHHRWTLRDALRDAGRVLTIVLGGALVALAAALPLGLTGAVLVTAGAAQRRRRRERAL